MKEKEQSAQNSIPNNVQFPIDYHENISMLVDMLFRLDDKVTSGEIGISTSIDIIDELFVQLKYMQGLYTQRSSYIKRDLPIGDD